MNNRIFSPGPALNTVRAPDGSILSTPHDWILPPPGDAALTRRVKAAGDHWVVDTSELQSHSQCRLLLESVTGVQTCDRKSTRLNSSHTLISYAVFCLQKYRLTRDKTCAHIAQPESYSSTTSSSRQPT